MTGAALAPRRLPTCVPSATPHRASSVWIHGGFVPGSHRDRAGRDQGTDPGDPVALSCPRDRGRLRRQRPAPACRDNLGPRTRTAMFHTYSCRWLTSRDRRFEEVGTWAGMVGCPPSASPGIDLGHPDQGGLAAKKLCRRSASACRFIGDGSPRGDVECAYRCAVGHREGSGGGRGHSSSERR